MKQDDEDKNGGDGVQQSQVSSSEPGPNILASSVIGPLLLEALDGFLFVVSSGGDIEFVSENVTNYIRYSPSDLMGKSIYHMIHVDDQLEFSNCLEPLVDRPHSTTQGDRPFNRSRSFSCRLQVKPNDATSESGSSVRPQAPQYETLQILAILQPCAHDRDSRDHAGNFEYPGNQYFLACIARRMNVMERLPAVHDVEQFFTKQDLHGKILACDTSGFSIDQRTLVAFIGHDIKDFCHVNDISQLNKHHREVLRVGSNLSGVYRMQLAPGHYVFVQTKSKLFKNSASGMPEFIMSTHSIVRKCDKDSELNGTASTSLMKALIGRSLPVNKNRDDTAKTSDHKPSSQLLSMNALRSSTSCIVPHGGSGSACHEVNNSSSGINNSGNDFDAACGNMSDMNDILDILQRQDSGTLSSADGSLTADFLSAIDCGSSNDSFVSEFCHQPDGVGGGTENRLIDCNLLQRSAGNVQGGGGSCFEQGNSSSPAGIKSDRLAHSVLAGNLPYFSGSTLTDDDVTSLLTSILPNQRQHQQRRQQQQRQQQQQQFARPSHSPATTTVQLPPPRSAVSQFSQIPQVSATASSPMSSRGFTSSPLPMMSPSPCTSPRQGFNFPQAALSGDGARHVPFIEHLRRVKCGMAPPGPLMSPNSSMTAAMAASTTGKGIATTPTSAGMQTASCIGLKDLLLSNDDDENDGGSGISPGSGSSTCDKVTLSLQPSDSSSNVRSGSGPSSSTSSFDEGKVTMSISSCDRPDSSTKRSKPAVLLMRLLSRQDDDADADDGASSGDSTSAASTVSPTTTAGHASTPRNAEKLDDADGEVEKSAAEPSRNNLLRQLLNDEKEEESPTLRPIKLLEKLMSNELPSSGSAAAMDSTSTTTTSHSVEVTGSQCQQLPQPSKQSRLEKMSSRERYRPRQGERDQLKEQLAKLWERDDSSVIASMEAATTTTTTAGVKRKASAVETPADSTDDAVASSSVSSAGGGGGGGRRNSSGKASKNNILLASLLSTRATAEPVLNTLSIGSVATAIPQMSLRRPSVDPSAEAVSSFPVSDMQSGSGSSHSKPTKSSSSSLSALESLMADRTRDFMAASEKSPSVGGNNGSLSGRSTMMRPNAVFSEANFSLASADGSSSIMEPDDDLNRLLHEVMPMDVEALGAIGTGSSASLVDDSALLNQLEQILSSPSMNLMELDSLLGDAGIGEPTSSQCAVPPDQAAISVIQNQLMTMESPSAVADNMPSSLSLGRGHSGIGGHGHASSGGLGLLGQLLGSTDQFSDVPAGAAAAPTCIASDVFPQRQGVFGATSVPTLLDPSQQCRPSGCPPVLANSSGCLQTGRGGAQLSTGPASSAMRPSGLFETSTVDRQQSSVSVQHSRSTRHASGGSSSFPLRDRSSFESGDQMTNMTNLNDLLNVSFAPNVSLQRNQRFAAAPSAGAGPSPGQSSTLMKGTGLPPSPFSGLLSTSSQAVATPSPAQPSSEDWTQRLNTMMTGGGVIQGNNFNGGLSTNVTSAPAVSAFDSSQFGILGHSSSGRSRLSHPSGSSQPGLQSPPFSSEITSPRSVSSISSHSLVSPFSTAAHPVGICTKPSLSSITSSVMSLLQTTVTTTAAVGSISSQPNMITPAPSSLLYDVKDEKINMDSFAGMKVSVTAANSGDGCVRGASVMSSGRRGSCSLEVMQGLRAKCHARFHQSSQQPGSAVDAPMLSPAVTTSSLESGELPPDILQSLSDLTDTKGEPMSTMDDSSFFGTSTESNGVPELNGSSLDEFLASWGDVDLDLTRLDLPLESASVPVLLQQQQQHQPQQQHHQQRHPEQSEMNQLDAQMMQRQLPTYASDPRSMQQQQQGMMGQCHEPMPVWPQQQQHQFDPQMRMDIAPHGSRGSHQMDMMHQQQQQPQQQQFDTGLKQQQHVGKVRSLSGIHGSSGSHQVASSHRVGSHHSDMEYGTAMHGGGQPGILSGGSGGSSHSAGMMPNQMGMMGQQHGSGGMMQGSGGPGMGVNDSPMLSSNQLQNLQVMVANQSNMMRANSTGSSNSAGQPSHSRLLHGGSMQPPNGAGNAMMHHSQAGMMQMSSHRSMSVNSEAGVIHHGQQQQSMMQGGMMTNRSSSGMMPHVPLQQPQPQHMGSFQQQQQHQMSSSQQLTAMDNQSMTMPSGKNSRSMMAGSNQMGGMMQGGSGIMPNQHMMMPPLQQTQQRDIKSATKQQQQPMTGGMMHGQAPLSMLPSGGSAMNPKQLRNMHQQQMANAAAGSSSAAMRMPMMLDFKESHLESPQLQQQQFHWMNSPTRGMSPLGTAASLTGGAATHGSPPKGIGSGQLSVVATNQQQQQHIGGLSGSGGMHQSPSSPNDCCISGIKQPLVDVLSGDELQFMRSSSYRGGITDDGFRSRQQMLPMATAPDGGHEAKNRLTHSYRRQVSGPAGGGMMQSMTGNVTGTGAPCPSMNLHCGTLTSLGSGGSGSNSGMGGSMLQQQQQRGANATRPIIISDQVADHSGIGAGGGIRMNDYLGGGGHQTGGASVCNSGSTNGGNSALSASSFHNTMQQQQQQQSGATSSSGGAGNANSSSQVRSGCVIAGAASQSFFGQPNCSQARMQQLTTSTVQDADTSSCNVMLGSGIDERRPTAMENRGSNGSLLQQLLSD